MKERRRGRRRERRLSPSPSSLCSLSTVIPGAHTSAPEFLEAPLDPLDLQQKVKHLIVRLHQRGCEDGVQGPWNLQRESVSTPVHETLSMYTTSHRPAVKELIATIEATVDVVSFQGSCMGAAQELSQCSVKSSNKPCNGGICLQWSKWFLPSAALVVVVVVDVVVGRRVQPAHLNCRNNRTRGKVLLFLVRGIELQENMIISMLALVACSTNVGNVLTWVTNAGVRRPWSGKKGWIQSSALLKYCTSSPEDAEWLNMGY